MNGSKIIIAGAGAAGLMAARELIPAGYEVVILEARERSGGRIFTRQEEAFNTPVELGAEFIHGKLPLTLALLKEYGLEKKECGGRFYSIVNGEFRNNPEIVMDYHHELEKQLKDTKRDSSVQHFLQTHFPEPRYQLLRHSVTKFVEGYDTADSHTASLLAFKEEWLGAESKQYRLEGGYGRLMAALEIECMKAGAAIFFEQVIKEIHWQKDHVTVKTSSGNTMEADKMLITFPLGVWKLNPESTAGFRFVPEIKQWREAAGAMGYGSLIKFLIQFSTRFWNKKSVNQWTGIENEEIGFVFSDEAVPTWWTQYPDENPLLTGWLGGPNSLKYTDCSEQELLKMALASLEKIFNEIQEPKAYSIINWNKDPFSAGSYSYAIPGDKALKKILNTPVESTLFLAGEALHNGKSSATVEAALHSGKEVAEKIISGLS